MEERGKIAGEHADGRGKRPGHHLALWWRNGSARVTNVSLGGAPRTRQTLTRSAQVTQLAWICSAEAMAITSALFNFPDRTGADTDALGALITSFTFRAIY